MSFKISFFEKQKKQTKQKVKTQQIYLLFFNIFFLVAGVDEVSAHANSASSLTLDDPAEVKTTESLRYLKTNSLLYLSTGTF